MAPYAPGGNIDVTARIIADKLKDVLGVTVLVENKAGACGMIGSDVIARSAARRLQPAGLGQLAGRRAGRSTATRPMTGRRRSSRSATSRRCRPCWSCTPSSPIKTLADFIKIGRETPGKLAVADSGVGTTNHIVIELMSDATGAKYTLVHYKGSGAGLDRRHRGPGAGAGRPAQQRDRPHQGGQAARHRRHVRQARAGAARRADRQGVRHQGAEDFTYSDLHGPVRPGQDAARGADQAQRGDGEGPDRPGDREALRRPHGRGQAQHAAGTRGHARQGGPARSFR